MGKIDQHDHQYDHQDQEWKDTDHYVFHGPFILPYALYHIQIHAHRRRNQRGFAKNDQKYAEPKIAITSVLDNRQYKRDGRYHHGDGFDEHAHQDIKEHDHEYGRRRRKIQANEPGSKELRKSQN